MTNEALMKTKLSIILTKEELDRIKFVNEADATKASLIVDMHELPAKKAMILLNNIINVDSSEKTVRVIHGFNHGVAIKKTIWNEYKNPHIVNKSVEPWNPGVTILEIA